MVDIKVLYWNLWGGFDNNCETLEASLLMAKIRT